MSYSWRPKSTGEQFYDQAKNLKQFIDRSGNPSDFEIVTLLKTIEGGIRELETTDPAKAAELFLMQEEIKRRFPRNADDFKFGASRTTLSPLLRFLRGHPNLLAFSFLIFAGCSLFLLVKPFLPDVPAAQAPSSSQSTETEVPPPTLFRMKRAVPVSSIPTPFAGPNPEIRITENGFSPGIIVLRTGTTLFWRMDTNVELTIESLDCGANLCQPNGIFYSGPMQEGWTFQFTFTEPGDYYFHLTSNPESVGEIIITDASPAPTLVPNRVRLKNSKFAPVRLEVRVGETVTFVNAEPPDGPAYTVTSGGCDTNSCMPTGLFHSGPLLPGNFFLFTFTVPGSYGYYSQTDPSMTGEIIVHP